MKEKHVYKLDENHHPNAKPIEYIITEEGCWTCISHRKNACGYTRVRRQGEELLRRIVYKKEIGEIPPGMCILHSCDQPACFNPAHLSVGSHADNMREMTQRGRSGYTKLADEDVRKIREDNRPLKEIAKDYGVSHTHVCGIRKGAQRKHVE